MRTVTNCSAYGPEMEVMARLPSLAGPEVWKESVSLSASLFSPSASPSPSVSD